MIRGIGIHGGEESTVHLHREDGPLSFRRGTVTIPADMDSVVATDLCTVLGRDGASVATVEHLLAALQLRGYWSGVLIEVDGPELPILDGSAQPWLAAIDDLPPPCPAPAPLAPITPVSLSSGASRLSAVPGRPHLYVEVDYRHPAIGRQSWAGGPEAWNDLLDARTFGFLEDLERLQAAGRARGARIENAIVFDESRPLSQLRHPDEPVRHKALDLIGDLTLLGRPLHARVEAVRGSHRFHLELMRHLVDNLTEADTNR